MAYSTELKVKPITQIDLGKRHTNWELIFKKIPEGHVGILPRKLGSIYSTLQRWQSLGKYLDYEAFIRNDETWIVHRIQERGE